MRLSKTGERAEIRRSLTYHPAHNKTTKAFQLADSYISVFNHGDAAFPSNLKSGKRGGVLI